MRIPALLIVTLAASACAATKPKEQAPEAAPVMTGALPGDRIPAFHATVRRPDGKAVREEGFDSLAAKRATVYIVNSVTCPYCAAYVVRMRRIEDAYLRKVDIVHIYPNRAETPEEKKAWHAEKGFRGGQILDTDASIAHLLEADRTPTVYLVDANGILLYRGAIDDSYQDEGGTPHLANAIDAHLAGKPVAVTSTEPAG